MEKGGRKPALRAVCKEELAGWLAEIHMEANTARARPGRGPLTPERTVQCRTGPSKRKQRCLAPHTGDLVSSPKHNPLFLYT